MSLVEFRVKNGKFFIKLRITRPQSKVRIKRIEEDYVKHISAPSSGGFILGESDYIEWQITNEQLKDLFRKARKIGLIEDNDIEEIRNFINSVRDDETIEDRFANKGFLRETTSQTIKGGFYKVFEKITIFVKKREDYFIEIAVKPRQRALNLQAMVYVCIFIRALRNENGDFLINKKPSEKENKFAILEITPENKQIIIDIMKAFSIASKSLKNYVLSLIRNG